MADARSCNFNTQTRPRINHDPSAMRDGCYSNSSANNGVRDAETSERGSLLYCVRCHEYNSRVCSTSLS